MFGSKASRQLAWLASALVMLVAVMALGAGTASSKTSRATGTPVVWSNSGGYVAGRNCANVGCSVQYWIKNGTAFATLCWVDTVWQYVNYSSPRWFYGYYTLATGGWKYYTWVHASQVYYQQWTPHC
jgi:hypothetical protein